MIRICFELTSQLGRVDLFICFHMSSFGEVGIRQHRLDDAPKSEHLSSMSNLHDR